MNALKLVVAQVSNNEFVAASTDAPFFCTAGESAEAVRTRASRAAQFYRAAIARRTPIAPRIVPQVVDKEAPDIFVDDINDARHIDGRIIELKQKTTENQIGYP